MLIGRGINKKSLEGVSYPQQKANQKLHSAEKRPHRDMTRDINYLRRLKHAFKKLIWYK